MGAKYKNGGYKAAAAPASAIPWCAADEDRYGQHRGDDDLADAGDSSGLARELHRPSSRAVPGVRRIGEGLIERTAPVECLGTGEVVPGVSGPRRDGVGDAVVQVVVQDGELERQR